MDYGGDGLIKREHREGRARNEREMRTHHFRQTSSLSAKK